MSTYAKAETLVGAVVAPLDWTRSALLVVGFSLLTAAAAQVVVPLPWTPVPLTGQTFAVLLTGALLGPRLGALAMVAYLAEGAAGLPFFRGGAGGVGHLMGPTAGYLFLPVMPTRALPKSRPEVPAKSRSGAASSRRLRLQPLNRLRRP